MTAQQYFDSLRSETKIRLDSAAIAGALCDGTLRRTPAERLDILMSRMRAHKAAGRMQAARAAARMAKRLLDQMDAQ